MTINTYKLNERDSKEFKLKVAIFGENGVGKTSLIKTLDYGETLLLNAEDGLLPIKNLSITTANIMTYQDCLDVIPMISFDGKGFKNLVVDSITYVYQLFAEEKQSKTSEEGDKTKLYGELLNEFTNWINKLISAFQGNIILLGATKTKLVNKINITLPKFSWSRVFTEIYGSLDEILLMVNSAGKRSFICKQNNDFQFPIKDRSNLLEMYEDANLNYILSKIKGE